MQPNRAQAPKLRIAPDMQWRKITSIRPRRLYAAFIDVFPNATFPRITNTTCFRGDNFAPTYVGVR